MNTFNTNLPSMNYERANIAAVTHRRRIFVLGSCVEMFDIDTKRWTTIPSMSTAHGWSAAVTLGDDIIVLGNGTAGQYNAMSKQWSPFPSMNTGRDGFAAAVVDGKIIVVGGFEDHGIFLDGKYLAIVEEYDPSTGEWRELTPMNVERSGCTTAVLEGKLYVVGGFDGDIHLSSVEVYDPATQQWTLLNDMTTPRRHSAAVPLEGRIVVAGGYDGGGDGILSSCEVYDPTTQKWSRIASMHSERCGCAAVEVEGDIYVLGGVNERRQHLSSVEHLPFSTFFAFLLDDKPRLAKELGIDDKAMPAFLSFVGRNCRMLTLWKVIRNRQDLLNGE